MRVWLLHPDRDFNALERLANADTVRKDLRLDLVFQAMSGGDEFLTSVAQMVVLGNVRDVATIRYRQEILQDCLAHPEMVQTLYDLAVRTLERRKGLYFGLSRSHPASTLQSAITLLDMLAEMLAELAAAVLAYRASCQSPGLLRFCDDIQQHLTEDYLRELHILLDELRFRRGMSMTAHLGPILKGSDYVVEAVPAGGLLSRGWRGRAGRYQFTLADRDERGHAALADLIDGGLAPIAQVVAGAADHVLDFFSVLRTELAFYLGACHLHQAVVEAGVGELTFPTPLDISEWRLAATGLYDLALALDFGRPVVGNDLACDQMRLGIITGANEGGKSTFLRSVGIAQLMMQCGLFVPAQAFSANVAAGVFTHFTRQEDRGLSHGKLDEELERLDRIVDDLGPHALLLCNESFATTNAREGAELAREIILALVDAEIKVLFVTHVEEFARGVWDDERSDTVFLRAERLDDGTRTFRVLVGEPLATSFAADLYAYAF